MADPAELIAEFLAGYEPQIHRRLRQELAKKLADDIAALTPTHSAEDAAVLDALEEAYADVLDIPDKIAGVDSIAAVNARHTEARAAVLARMAKKVPEGWRDISAAPKDRYVWIWDGEVRVLARWHQAIKAWIGTDERGIAYDSRRYNAPTPVLAWQNLPAAPKVPT